MARRNTIISYLLGAAAALCFFLTATMAHAQEFVSTHGNWSVFSVNQGGKVCYIASAPTGQSGNFSKRGDPYILVTHRSAAVDEVSVSSGYGYKAGEKVNVSVDGKNFGFFSKEEIAWAENEQQDAAIVTAMKKGNKMVVRGNSQRGTHSEDTYSLKGVSAAYQKMKSLCQQ